MNQVSVKSKGGKQWLSPGHQQVMELNNVNSHLYRNPLMAAIWSLFLPGFGQFYNGDYLTGFVLMVWEILVNTMGGINLSIFFAFNGELERSFEVLDFQWALFYPSVYAFSVWQAYQKASNINRQLAQEGVPRPEKVTYHDGLFIGLALGLFFGLIWSFTGNPVIGALSGGVIGVASGFLAEKILESRT